MNAQTHYRHSPEQARLLSDKCLQFLQSRELSATPVNYIVVYEMLAGNNPELLHAVRELTDKNELDGYRLRDLYNTFLNNASDLDQEVLYPISNLLSDIASSVEQSSDQVEHYQQELKAGCEALTSVQDPKQVLAALAKATEVMRQDQLKMHKRLQSAETEVSELRNHITRLEKESVTDPLSQLMNRTGFDKSLDAKPVEKEDNCVVIFDIDHFKKVNDSFGHVFGDNVIRQVAKQISDHSRGLDIAARWGGEEFILVLRDTDLKGGTYVAEKIRKAIENLRWKNTRTGERLPPVTISGGITQLRQSENLQDNLDVILHRADEALYRAKENGRNNICR